MQSSRQQNKDWKKWINNQWFVKNIPFFLFLAFLAVLYIANGHYADNVIRKTGRTANEINELEYEYKTVKGALMNKSKQSEIFKRVSPMGLKEATEPPYFLNDSSKAD